MTPPGWYPNPDGSDSTRYWDGQQWTVVATKDSPAAPTLAERTPVTPAQKKSNRKWLIGAGAFLAILIVASVAINGGEDDDATEAAATPSSAAHTTTPAPAARRITSVPPAPPAEAPARAILPPVTTTRVKPAAVCLDAPAEYLDAINSSFIGGYSFGEVKAVRKGELWYIAGQVHNAEGGIRSRDDLFVAKDLIVSPVSTTARNESALPDLRKVLDVSFTDDAAQAALDCARTY